MTIWAAFVDLLLFATNDPLHFLVALIPFVLFFEMPLYVLIVIGNLIHFWEGRAGRLTAREYSPSVSCIVTCYNEGEAVKLTFRTLFEQLYDGSVEVIAVIDGSIQNAATLRAAQEFAREHGARYPLRVAVEPGPAYAAADLWHVRLVLPAVGVVLGVSLAVLLFWAMLRDRVYLLYAGAMLFQLLYALCSYGEAYAWPGLSVLARFGA